MKIIWELGFSHSMQNWVDRAGEQ